MPSIKQSLMRHNSKNVEDCKSCEKRLVSLKKAKGEWWGDIVRGARAGYTPKMGLQKKKEARYRF